MMKAIVTMKFFLCLLCIVPCLSFTPRQQPRFNHNKSIERNNNKRQLDSSRSYANLADPPLSGGKPSFHTRMRNLVLNNPPVQRDQSSSSTSPGHPAVYRVTNLQDYKRLVVDQGKITVVCFYADYCRSCRAMKPTFYRLAQNNPQVQWVEVPVTKDTAPIHSGLGVPSTPFGHVYHPEQGLVEEVRLRKEFLKDFAQILESYQANECALPEEPNPETGLYDAPYTRHS